MTVKTPDWVKHAVFYQIFPDRFARSPRMPELPGVVFKPWASSPAEQGFQGGNLYGIVDKLDYLRELGINALYLNPIFSSACNHRYHTYDYLQVDPLLGGNEAFRVLLDEAHSRDMRVVLDGVFNHASRGFWAFHHILEEGERSPYIDWFIIHGWPLNPYYTGKEQTANYASWWNLPALPKFNIKNPGVRRYLLDVARYWVEFGIDGWRLDVPEEINDPPFWHEFRRTVKEANPDAYLVGEIWHDAKDWLTGDRFDAVMNYVFKRSAVGFFAGKRLRPGYKPGGYHVRTLAAEEFAASVERFTSLHDWQIVQAQLNLLDSHDTARFLWIADGDESALRLCALFQMTMPGAPCIYYGDEIGMTGGEDPECRAAFPWHDESLWNRELLAFYQRAIQMRHEHPVLRTGRYATLFARDDLFVFQRLGAGSAAVVAFNNGEERAVFDIALGSEVSASLRDATFVDVWNRGEGAKGYAAHSGRLASIVVPPRSAAVLIAQ